MLPDKPGISATPKDCQSGDPKAINSLESYLGTGGHQGFSIDAFRPMHSLKTLRSRCRQQDVFPVPSGLTVTRPECKTAVLPSRVYAVSADSSYAE